MNTLAQDLQILMSEVNRAVKGNWTVPEDTQIQAVIDHHNLEQQVNSLSTEGQRDLAKATSIADLIIRADAWILRVSNETRGEGMGAYPAWVDGIKFACGVIKKLHNSEVGKLRKTLSDLRNSISDFQGHGMPGFTDRAKAYVVLYEADQVLANKP